MWISPSAFPVFWMISWIQSSLRKARSLRMNLISMSFSSAMRRAFTRICSVRDWEKFTKYGHKNLEDVTLKFINLLLLYVEEKD